MSASIAAGLLNSDTPRSPVSISTDSSRRGSPRQVPPERQSEPPRPNSPRTRSARRRVASLNTDAANEPRIGDIALHNSRRNGPLSSDPTREQVCLCQPDPKIPRPRNAFILYRQHYQAQVVAQNRGLTNPEISKIIGEQWREQDPDVKSDWKRLAEEEKQRHQRQYPNYRYQPRRAGKSNGLRPISASVAEDQVRCPKCHGKYITTPNTPMTPFIPATGAEAQSGPHLSTFSTLRATELERPMYSAKMQHTRVDTPHPLPHQQGNGRIQYGPPRALSTHHERDEEMDILSPSPGHKRRRFNEDNQRGYAANSPISYSAPLQFRGPSSMPTGAYRPQQLPGPAMLGRPGSMGPPPQLSPINQQPRHQYTTRSNIFDESLRLPPLQTQASAASSISSQRQDIRMEAREIHARSVEAMVMTIPYVSKIKLLQKVSPPLQSPGPTDPAQDIRGAVVAVEGHDKTLLAEVSAFILDYLRKDPSLAVRTWGSATPSDQSSQAADTEMVDATALAATPFASSLSADTEANDPIVDYLSTVSDWHQKSHEIIKYITTSPASQSSVHDTDSSASTNDALIQNTKTLPVALVPNGFSLTISDVFALRTPINDSYAPVDHWQWMATLWRGIVGPDIIIYVTRVGKEELGKHGGVEIRVDCSTIIVRIPETGKMDEKTARRLGFEVVEIVRNVETGFVRV